MVSVVVPSLAKARPARPKASREVYLMVW
jgi:hypothetical protein